MSSVTHFRCPGLDRVKHPCPNTMTLDQQDAQVRNPANRTYQEDSSEYQCSPQNDTALEDDDVSKRTNGPFYSFWYGYRMTRTHMPFRSFASDYPSTSRALAI